MPPPRSAAPASLAAQVLVFGDRGVLPAHDVVVLAPRGSRLRQIARHLSASGPVQAIVIALAGPHDLCLPGDAGSLRRIGRALGPDGVILLSGPDASDSGLIEAMARYAGVRVVGLHGLPLAAGGPDSAAGTSNEHYDA